MARSIDVDASFCMKGASSQKMMVEVKMRCADGQIVPVAIGRPGGRLLPYDATGIKGPAIAEVRSRAFRFGHSIVRPLFSAAFIRTSNSSREIPQVMVRDVQLYKNTKLK